MPEAWCSPNIPNHPPFFCGFKASLNVGPGLQHVR